MSEESHEEEIVKGESKEDRFKRLAELRVNKALDKIRLIGNLSSSQYEFSAEQIEKIMVALQSALAEVEEKFQKRLDHKRKQFEL